MSTPTLEKTGIITDLPAEEYFAHPGLGSTSINALGDPELSLSEVYHKMHTDERKDVYDIGTLGHALILEGSLDHLVERVDSDAYRTKEAKEAKARALNAGLIPINDSQVESILKPVEAMHEAVKAHPIAHELLTGGESEVSIFWEQDSVPMKGRLDYWHRDSGVVVDLKLLRSAQPNSVRKQISDLGYYIQRHHYLNGVQALTGFRPDWYWVTIGKDAPYSVSVHKMSAEVDHAAAMRISYALQRYKQATETNDWPGYTAVYEHGITPWEAIKNEELEEQIS